MNTTAPNPNKVGLLEKAGSVLDTVRFWLLKSWRIGSMMIKGSYLIGEQRHLFEKLGEDAFKRYRAGEISVAEWEPLAHQLDRLAKKIELEEMLIRNARFPEEGHRRRPPTGEGTETAAAGAQAPE